MVAQVPVMMLRRSERVGGDAAHPGDVQPLIAARTASPRVAGLSATVIPADFIASILSSAPPLPPATMAPAWPMRRPGVPVRPARKPTPERNTRHAPPRD